MPPEQKTAAGSVPVKNQKLQPVPLTKPAGKPAANHLYFSGKTRTNTPGLKNLTARVEALETLCGTDKTACKTLKSLPKKLKALSDRLEAHSRQLNRMTDDYNAMLAELEREPLPAGDLFAGMDPDTNTGTPAAGAA